MHTVLYEPDYECETCVEWLLFKKQYCKKLRNLDKFEPIATKKHFLLSKIYLFYKGEKLFSEQNLVYKLIPLLLMHKWTILDVISTTFY